MTRHANTLPAFEPRQAISDPDHVYGELKKCFMIGEFEPGQRLTLPELAQAFGTSQMPVREATSRLVVARAIEALPRRSLRVPEATVERLDALLPLRLHLEGEATRLAALHARDGIAADLRRIDDEMREIVPTQDTKTYLRLNQEFHFTIYNQSGNADLVDLIELLWMRYAPLMNIVRSGVLSKTGQFRHAEIIDALARRDAPAAAVAMCGDLAEAGEAIRAAISARG
ncbi:transcriptional regulator, GntR family [Paracoccus thiocyanatus]|uniref:Transcriptional regulator, GntR family n=1 Tax=Paracoccus thiocyanatus TaxID=34006 RepID=A0A1N6U7Y7_9RHOB|nr:GntR family transcriptional regulator [Paracoccus thiocyanatus]SIQ61752.1 transcriptional regulator, GntR family [Paracoccus thiocyanatus]